MRAAIAALLALASATGCYARSASGGGPTIQRTAPSAPDLANERPDTNHLPTAQR